MKAKAMEKLNEEIKRTEDNFINALNDSMFSKSYEYSVRLEQLRQQKGVLKKLSCY